MWHSWKQQIKWNHSLWVAWIKMETSSVISSEASPLFLRTTGSALHVAVAVCCLVFSLVVAPPLEVGGEENLSRHCLRQWERKKHCFWLVSCTRLAPRSNYLQRRHQVRKYHQVLKYPRVHCTHGLCAGEIFACSTDEKKKIVTFLTTLLPKCRARRGAFSW